MDDNLAKQTVLQKLPEWTITWYRQNNIRSEFIDFRNVKDTSSYSTDELSVANCMLDLCKFVLKKRSAPKAIKICKKCNIEVLVNSAKQSCTNPKCDGKLELVTKPLKEIKRKAPMCTKKCQTCDKIFENVPTALQRCNGCGEKIYIVK